MPTVPDCALYKLCIRQDLPEQHFTVMASVDPQATKLFYTPHAL